jgi:glutathione synthase
MKLLFVADPLDTFKIYKDSTFAMMREASRRGHTIWATQPVDLSWQRGGRVQARALQLTLTGVEGHSHHAWYTTTGLETVVIAEFDAVLMRKDPPFDSEFFYATHLLSHAERDGALVLNSPAALREHPEKLAILEFPQFIAPTLVTRSAADVRAFHAEHRDIILKPLDGMGGMGIFRVKDDGLNLGSIVETLNRDGAETIMVQKFVPQIVDGDKRVLVIDGKPVPHTLARIPQGGEVRGNLAAGGLGVARPITDREREIAGVIGPKLARRGLLLIGLDVIGDVLTEINVTSPTCFQEITDQSGFDVAKMFVDALEATVSRTQSRPTTEGNDPF